MDNLQQLISELKAVVKSCRDQVLSEEDTRVQLFFSLHHLDLMIEQLEKKHDNV